MTRVITMTKIRTMMTTIQVIRIIVVIITIKKKTEKKKKLSPFRRPFKSLRKRRGLHLHGHEGATAHLQT